LAYDTKALISSIALNVAKSKTLKEAYVAIMKTANVEGVCLPSYEEQLNEIKELRENVTDIEKKVAEL